jgi:hypothetical protein
MRGLSGPKAAAKRKGGEEEEEEGGIAGREWGVPLPLWLGKLRPRWVVWLTTSVGPITIFFLTLSSLLCALHLGRTLHQSWAVVPAR